MSCKLQNYLYASSPCTRTDSIYSAGQYSVGQGFKNFFQKGNLDDLIKCIGFCGEKGWIAQLASAAGLASVDDIPKEFEGIEYEVKFDIQVAGKGKEPEVTAFLDAFDFPASKRARFLKDPVNAFAVGVNNFYGTNFYGTELDEKLVVIEKGGGLYVKEKGPVVPVNVGVEYQDIIVKRTERRYQASFEEAMSKVQEVSEQLGARYQGKIRKEKGDAFILDTSDGRIYSFTITRAHLVKPGEKKESETQRQLEIEYAGYIPKFKGLEKDSEEQIIRGMVDLAKYVYVLYGNAPIESGWRMQLRSTGERKYDFIVEASSGRLQPKAEREVLKLPEPE